ncbi:MAG: metalloregulator ArsR/SmtB family transcription factor [Bacillota bacterium]
MKDYVKAIKSLSEKTRIRILALLHQSREVCVSEIVEALQEDQYKISRHLKVLQDAGMVVRNKKGRWIYYQLNESQVHFQKMLLDAVKTISSEILKEDVGRLQQNVTKRATNHCSSNEARKYQENYH